MTLAPLLQPPLVQVTLSVIDLQRSERWFCDGLGFLPAGGSTSRRGGPQAARTLGLPAAAAVCWWLVGRNPWCQLALVQFGTPVAALMPDDARACDIGYRRIGVWLADFDAALRRLAALGSPPISAVLGEAGERRACVRSPDGVFVELMEHDPLPQRPADERAACGVALRSVTLSTPDLAQSVAGFKALCAREPSLRVLHTPEHEALWGLAGARTRSVLFECGDVLLEALQYLDPVGQPWPAGERVTAQGIVDIGLAACSQPGQREMLARAMALGARARAQPLDQPGADGVCVDDAQGFPIELRWLATDADARLGFVPLPAGQRPPADTHRVEGSVEIAAPLAAVWAVLNDQDRMGAWIGFKHVKRRRAGFSTRDGRGSERFMQGLPGTVVEQVTAVEAMSRICYRVIDGGPVDFHQGEIELEPSGQGTRVSWSVRYRAKLPLLSGLLRVVLQALVSRVLARGLKPHAERVARASARPHA